MLFGEQWNLLGVMKRQGGFPILKKSKVFRTPRERRDFMEAEGLRYLRRCEYVRSPVFALDQKQSPYYKQNRREFEVLHDRYHESIKQGAMAEFSIRVVSEDVGWGLFAEEALETGAFVGEYCGVVGPGKVFLADGDKSAGREGFETDYAWDYPDAWNEDILYEVNAREAGNELRYVNHSFDANLEVDHCLVDQHWILFFKAARPLVPGTQLTVDYGEEYWAGGFRELVLF